MLHSSKKTETSGTASQRGVFAVSSGGESAKGGRNSIREGRSLVDSGGRGTLKIFEWVLNGICVRKSRIHGLSANYQSVIRTQRQGSDRSVSKSLMIDKLVIQWRVCENNEV